ncbi:hypothetical protein BO78DRAFT_308444 [Aspergillus sclerotiicarbonarius CBS 121057]|uniref:F-box domain-containing protein n=1 Tax=Aspergillus sclerotiicarbonarius (strain CBS 121057 / IBT 28362) TaxID=1448318 RepID=A0A319FLJ6_ASPSB|nr:hypothetical protein BO78DRAFT_308444 [Aspergillus sclerotiicarbonarius CBS 121057]
MDIHSDKETRPTTPLQGVLESRLTSGQKTAMITELLVMIMLNLPFESLLHCQRVCRHFQAVIQQTPALRRALFLEAPTTPLLDQPRLNPFLNRILCSETICEVPPTSLHQSGSLFDLPWYQSETRRKAVTYEKASWRRMLPSNIPCYVHEATIASSRQQERSWLAERAPIRGEFGPVNLKALWDMIVGYLGYWKTDKFVVIWTVADANTEPVWKVSIGEPESIPPPSSSIKEEVFECLSDRTLQEFLEEDPDRRVEWYTSQRNEWPIVVQW